MSTNSAPTAGGLCMEINALPDGTFDNGNPDDDFIINPNDLTIEEYAAKYGEHKPWINVLSPIANWSRPADEPAPRFEYGPLTATPIHNLKHELSLPLIDEAYDAIESVCTAESGSGEKVRVSRESANGFGGVERMGDKSNTGKFRSHVSNAGFLVSVDRSTNWSNKPDGI